MVAAFDTDTGNHQTVIGWVGGQKVLHLAVPNCPTDYRSAKDAFDREFIVATLRSNGGSISRAAQAMKVSRRHLYTRIAALGVDIPSLQAAPIATSGPVGTKQDDKQPSQRSAARGTSESGRIVKD